jgi:hypothetical protein
MIAFNGRLKRVWFGLTGQMNDMKYLEPYDTETNDQGENTRNSMGLRIGKGGRKR